METGNNTTWWLNIMASLSDSELASKGRYCSPSNFKQVVKFNVAANNKKEVKFKVATNNKNGKRKTDSKDNPLFETVKLHISNIHEKQLLSSICVNNIENVERLLLNGVSANTSDGIGRSALHFAVSRGYTDMVRVLLQCGANPNCQDIVQNTPLHLAACANNLQIITLLIDAGADIRALDLNGRNPLHLAKSRLRVLRQRNRQSGAMELVHIRRQVEEIVDLMISLWRHKQSTSWGHHRENTNDLELMKLSLSSGPEDQVDDQMNKLLEELQKFSF